MTLVTENNKMIKDNNVEEMPVKVMADKVKEPEIKPNAAETKPLKKSEKIIPASTAADKKPVQKVAKKETVKPSKEKKVANNISTEKIETPIAALPEVIITAKPATKKTTTKKTETRVKASKEITLKKTVLKKIIEKILLPGNTIKLTFLVRFHTKPGQSLYVTGDHAIFGNNEIAAALPMQYLSEELWITTIELNKNELSKEGVVYNYVLKNADGAVSFDWGNDKILKAGTFTSEETLMIDSWNFAGYFENVFYTEPFKNVLLKHNGIPVKKAVKTYTHTFKIKAPLLKNDETICMVGNDASTGSWNEDNALLFDKKQGDDFFTINVNLSKTIFPLVYKYGVYNTVNNKFLRYEEGSNRILYDAFVKNKKTIVNDGFVVLPSTSWKGAGVAIPVFSLRSQKSCGVGEFTDINLLVDWAKLTGLKLIQILPVNDTTATHSWTDSYPYAAISAFALHPMYLNLAKAAGEAHKALVNEIAAEQQALNKLETVDYEAVNNLKWRLIKQLYPLQKEVVFALDDYKNYFELNKHWLIPYAAFCYFRDKYNNADFNTWHSHKNFDDAEIAALLQPDAEAYNELAIHFYVQYLLHLQLKEATQYAHDNGIIVKGDIPIGIYRYGADAWQHPELYHMDMQAGAPPDDFAVTGQNWGFPTYNWEKMKEDGFTWWKYRFAQMSYYFDAFRIDHILGFFRIWSIPTHSVEGIMGHFEPSIPVHINEFHEKNIWFDFERYCRPFITEDILNQLFGDQKDHVKYSFLNYNGFGNYHLKSEYNTQRQIENYFSWQQDNEHNRWLKTQLFTLVSNVIMFEAEGSQGQQFHFRFGMQDTLSYKNLDGHLQYQLQELYIDYFFRRQDAFWMQGAMQKLPALKRATNMLVCGEDLGLVPGCVPEVMRQLGLLSLEIQRMPKDPDKTFSHPANAPYLSVVTPSTHDISTIRGWWEEDRNLSQRFFNDELGQWGGAPYLCDAWVNKLVVVQHLYSPAMWSIFQLQDMLGINRKIRRADPNEERINVPANPQHYWRYRMHLTLEALLKADEFNNEFATDIKASGRA